MKLSVLLALVVLAVACDGARVVQIEDPGDEGLTGQRDGGATGSTDAGTGPTDAGATDAGAADAGGADAGAVDAGEVQDPDGGIQGTCAAPQHAVAPGAESCQLIDPSGPQCAKSGGFGLVATCCGRGATWSVPDAALRFCALSLLPSVQELACIVYL